MANFNYFILSNTLIWTTYSWTNNSSMAPQMAQINSVLITNYWEALFPKVLILVLPLWTFDHILLFTDT
ncbi:hypothetical protein AMTRI_Chr12g271370 [Amborella trichopoda]